MARIIDVIDDGEKDPIARSRAMMPVLDLRT
jgi:hypothetical protein